MSNDLDRKIRDYIHNEIQDHGHAYVTVRDLADEFDVSVSTVFHALRRLRVQGRLIMHPGHKNCYHEVH